MSESPEKDAIYAFKGYLDAIHIRHTGGNVEFDYTKPNALTYNDTNIKVTSYRTNYVLHGEFPSFSYVIEGDGKRILHTGDLECDFHDFPKIAPEEDFDVCICELTITILKKRCPPSKSVVSRN